jgi:hypothetical protein
MADRSKQHVVISTNLPGPDGVDPTVAPNVKLESTDRPITRTWARNVFLQQLAELAPDALKELDPPPPVPGSPLPDTSPEATKALDVWMARWRIEAEWVRCATSHAMQFWFARPSEPRTFQMIRTLQVGTFGRRTVTIDFEIPTSESRATAKKQAHAQLDAEFDRQWDEWLQAASQEGYVPPAARHSIRRHAGWLVRYLVRRDSFHAIADDEDMDIRAVKRGVKKLAKVIDLPLRR